MKLFLVLLSCYFLTLLVSVKLSEGKYILKANLEDICHHLYPNRFVFAAEVIPEECWITCYLLNADDHDGNIFSDIDVYNHTLYDETPCNKQSKCLNGTCTRYYNNGTLNITINEVTLNDTYTNVTYGGHFEVRIIINGQRAVTKLPNDKTAVVLLNQSRETKVRFDAANSIKKREVIAYHEVTVKNAIANNNGTNSVLMTSFHDNSVILNYTITWNEYQSNNV